MRSFALVYVEMGFGRATAEARGALVAPLLRGVAGRSEQQREMLLRLAMQGARARATQRHFVDGL